MAKKKSNHVTPGMGAIKAQGQGAAYNEEMGSEQISVKERMNNKKRKKNQ
jgi:small acid-soluble spore protein O (minor)